MYNKYCKICGAYSDGKPFCFDCYRKMYEKDHEKLYNHYQHEEYEDEDEYLFGEDFCDDYQDEYNHNGLMLESKYTINEDVNKKARLSYRFFHYIKRKLLFWKKHSPTHDTYTSKYCVVCGKPSRQHKYCKKCYYEIKSARESIKISNAQNDKMFKCKNNKYVKSESERIISDFLTDINIEHYYERPIPVDRNKENDIHPTFFVPRLEINDGRIIKNVYLDYWKYNFESPNYERYLQQTSYKAWYYQKMKLTIVFITEEDLLNPQESITSKLINIKENEINEWPE